MQPFSIAPKEMAFSLWRNRNLVASLVKREVVGRYRGSVMGILWSFLHPIFMLAVYTFVFSVVFKARWNVESESKTEFAVVLFAGLMVFNLFSECINRAPNLIQSNVNYVKKVIFPLEVLPWVAMGSSIFHGFISLTVWFIFYLIYIGPPHLNALLFPLILLPLILLTMGLSWLLASLGVYLRDIAQITGILTTTLLFLSPIFYPVSSLPPDYRSLLLLNPLSAVIEQARDVLIWNKLPDWHYYSLSLLASGTIAWLGFAWFQKTRKGFADVL
ncbi:ABC transporter permease [Methylosarcina fibrata]|uniref:ABC transporter permease n=1 Tax=Methylosarcina fibrata TaxID=105972 RepID=UPI00037472D2|nr:ABC transporter permease [Methylosarcina fibrata]